MEEKSQLNISKALVECQKMIKAAGMSGENKFDHYKYSNAPDIIEAIKPALEKNDLAVVFDQRYPEKTIRELRDTSTGKKEFFVGVTIACVLVHSSGETMVYTGQGDGQDRGDKALYKALTGAQKYLLRLIFNLPCKDDPEDDSKDKNDMDQRPPQTNGKAPASKGKYSPSKATPPSTVTEPTQVASAPLKEFVPPTDAEQEKLGRISNSQVKVISELYKQKGIPKEVFADWLGLFYGGKNPWAISKDKFNEVCNVILKTPEEIAGSKNEPPQS
jgi:hypothetical protein